MNGLLHHLLLTFRLNFRGKLPIIYGYLVPVFFLIGFAAVFRSAQPPIIHELGQLLTISTLGGACFGMPTAMVAERERGIWRRYRLLPTATGALILSTMIARLVLVASSALLQIVLAMWIYNMPMPAHPLQLTVAYLFVAFAFLGMGLVIAMLADTVPAVQALGQAIFLPMILIGGVGVPLGALPNWAQIIAGYLPGRYSVHALDACVFGPGLNGAFHSLIALLFIGAAACFAGTNMFRWDAGQKLTAKQRAWTAVALLAWAAVGVTAQIASAGKNPGANAAAFQKITDTQINAITYDDLADDNSYVTPLVEAIDDLDKPTRQWMDDFARQLRAWPPGNAADPLAQTVNLLSVAADADLGQFRYEGEVPHVVFQQLKTTIPKDQLERILAYIILQPDQISVRTTADELGIPGRQEQSQVRERVVQYAKKLLGRLLGKLG
jgi:ABC-type multidrug transport system permease subunit